MNWKPGPHIKHHSVEAVTLTELDQLIGHELSDQSVGQYVENVALGRVCKLESWDNLDLRVQSLGGLHKVDVNAMLTSNADRVRLLLKRLLSIQKILAQILVEVKTELWIELFVVYAELEFAKKQAFQFDFSLSFSLDKHFGNILANSNHLP